jgi:hypothetical protein
MLNFKILSCCLTLSTIVLDANTTLVCAQNTRKLQETEAKKFINLVTQTERAYFLELQKFVDNFNELNLTPPSNSYQYQINILDNGNLVQTIASPTKSTGLRTYTGAVSFNNRSLNSIFCVSESFAKVSVGQIQLIDSKLECPTGFRIGLFNAQQEAINSVDSTNGAQQAYYFETSKFTKNKNDLYNPMLLSNTYYNYHIDLLENGKIAQIIATPKFDNLKSYVGGTLQLNNYFQSILCVSKQPTKYTPSSIKLVDGKLKCPTGFNVELSKVQQDALNNVGTLNRAQQAYYFENSKFANNQNDLAILLSNTYYDYQLDILENGKLAQLKATPKLDNFKSYIGGTLYLNWSYQLIVCASEQPTKDIPQSIKLVDGKLVCPTGFEIQGD